LRKKKIAGLDLPQRHREHRVRKASESPPLGFCIDVKRKGLCEKGLVTAKVCRLGYPHPGCFAKRVWKLLKRNDGKQKKSAKREKESASP
jgi:hypothetical protein